MGGNIQIFTKDFYMDKLEDNDIKLPELEDLKKWIIVKYDDNKKSCKLVKTVEFNQNTVLVLKDYNIELTMKDNGILASPIKGDIYPEGFDLWYDERVIWV